MGLILTILKPTLVNKTQLHQAKGLQNQGKPLANLYAIPLLTFLSYHIKSLKYYPNFNSNTTQSFHFFIYSIKR